MQTTENPWKECLEFTAISELGLRRSNNQDSHDEIPARNQKIWNSRGHIFCVADGMGAHAAGELASKLATDTIPMVYLKQLELTPPEALTKAIQTANHVIHTKGNSDKELRGMGTTCDTLLILPEGALIGHVGDSRVYRLRGKKWEQMTCDHSVIWAKEEAGEVIDETVHKNVITRCLGVSPEVKVDLEGPWPIQKDDIFLLCSDGLCGLFDKDNSEMGKILSVLPLKEATRGLVDLANLRGGPDNITVVTVKYLGPQKARSSKDQPDVPVATETKMAVPPSPSWLMNLLGVSVGGLFFGLISLLFLPVLGLLLTILSLGGLGISGWKLLSKKAPKAFTRRMGKGPYRTYSAVCDEAFATELKNICSQLRTSAERQKKINYTKTDALIAKAKDAQEKKNYDEACKNFMLAISSIWNQLAN